jgi:GNAT superfamily N-acetyltransferase
VSVDDLRFRLAVPSDAEAVAALHADSWRRHYRGAFSDEFLDGDVQTERVAVWSERLPGFDGAGPDGAGPEGTGPDGASHTVVAEHGDELVGFVHTVFEADPRWGALIDNLHVAYAEKRRGIGSRLLTATARAALERGTGLYLWVLEQNSDARAFYEARGGKCVERALVPPPGGIASRLNGTPFGLRYAWPDPAVLV